MERKEIEQRTLEYFLSGFNCAEALSKAIVEAFSEGPFGDIPKVASGFGGGVGASKGETCGALTGAIIALGCLFGRNDPKEDKKAVYEFASEFRRKFIEIFGSGNCQSILDGLGEQQNMMKCKQLTGRAAGILFEMLEQFVSSTEGPA